jgi:hypothetical protein
MTQVDLISADGGGQLHPQLRLRSMYAEDPDDSLVFQVTSLSSAYPAD